MMIAEAKKDRSYTERRISEKVESLLKKIGLRRGPFAEKFGLHKSNFYRMLSGERGWTIENLEKTATGLGVSPSELLTDIPTVPLVAEITGQGFDYTAIGREKLANIIYVGGRTMLEKVYALKITNDDFRPHFRQGWTIFLQKGVDPSEFEDEDYIIYCRENGRGCLRQVALAEGGNQIILKALARDCKDLVIPADHLKLCDKVINIEL